ncbi:TonB-linked SusC/RagA family outer membrane protein [Thermoflavifilum aggregans]|uniref:TonB-linked SusC/RagA family outer membrane protein n=1 Tax=Thermoflavifilum aggregans TaxID=454188 RepID=A0A2M9CWW0_9BACT|nr:SusC/RagA family TonB-linked outer membrane protein [Thermoflavifilum aggregans]PJJ76383.1 TonB-linked SusC/RagA family outer membrane protein [Thermoflavifilum aggregans]
MKKVLLFLTALLFSTVWAFGQQRTITGKVVDQNGNPIPYATVQIQGTNQGTTTDQQGNFTIEAPANAVLHISYIGYQAKDVPVNNQSHLQVTLQSTAQALNEVVVTALGVQREARSLGYSVGEVNNQDLNVSKPINVAQGLVGRLAGVQVSTLNNGVNPTVRVQLRGERHIYSDNQALVVIDGVEVNPNQLATLNPEDIQSVSVLKGASAAALYGAEATNGVLIVTTKRGAEGGKPIINFSSTVTLEKISYFPKLQDQFSGYGGETGTFNLGPGKENWPAINPYTGFANYIPFENQQYGPPFDGNPQNGFIGGANSQGQYFLVPFRPIKPDQRIAFFNTGVTTQNNISYSGGDQKNSYLISLQDVNIKGVVPKDQARRTTARFNGVKTYGKFTAQYNLSYSRQTSDVAGNDFTQSNGHYNAPGSVDPLGRFGSGGWPVYWNILNTPANIPITSLKNWQDTSSFASINNYYNAYYTNPYWQIDQSRLQNKADNFQADLSASLQATSWLNILYRVGLVTNNSYQHDFRYPVQFSAYSSTDPWGAGNYQSGGPVAGSVWDGNDYTRRLQQDVLLTFTKKIGDYSGTLIVGNTIWDHYRHYQGEGSANLYLPGMFNIDYRQGEADVEEFISEERRIGTFGDLTLGYKNGLFLHGNFRRDYSSLLVKGHNAYNVWDVDASWVFTDFIPSIKGNILSYGKIRAAYSNTGQITVPPYSIQPAFNVTGGYPYGSVASLSLSSTYNNPNIVPENTIEKEVGLELGFWNDRINVEADYYRDNNRNQTLPVNLSSSTGYTSAFINAGEVLTWGWEFDVKVNPIIRTPSGFRWDAGANLSINDSKVLSLIGSVQDFNMGLNNHAVVGQPLPVMELTDLQRDPEGHVVIDPSTGYPILDNTPKIVGRTTPKYILGLNTDLKYKNFTLTIIGDYRGGYGFYSNAGQNLDFTGASAHTAQNGRQSFIFPNSVYQDPTTGKYVPNTNIYVYDGSIGFWVYSDYRRAGTTYWLNAAAWKVRTISLSYDFSQFIQRTKFIHGASFSLLANDVLMFRPKQNVWTDPEFNYTNSNSFGYTTFYELPPTRKFSAVLNLTF